MKSTALLPMLGFKNAVARRLTSSLGKEELLQDESKHEDGFHTSFAKGDTAQFKKSYIDEEKEGNDAAASDGTADVGLLRARPNRQGKVASRILSSEDSTSEDSTSEDSTISSEDYTFNTYACDDYYYYYYYYPYYYYYDYYYPYYIATNAEDGSPRNKTGGGGPRSDRSRAGTRPEGTRPKGNRHNGTRTKGNRHNVTRPKGTRPKGVLKGTRHNGTRHNGTRLGKKARQKKAQTEGTRLKKKKAGGMGKRPNGTQNSTKPVAVILSTEDSTEDSASDDSCAEVPNPQPYCCNDGDCAATTNYCYAFRCCKSDVFFNRECCNSDEDCCYNVGSFCDTDGFCSYPGYGYGK